MTVSVEGDGHFLFVLMMITTKPMMSTISIQKANKSLYVTMRITPFLWGMGEETTVEPSAHAVLPDTPVSSIKATAHFVNSRRLDVRHSDKSRCIFAAGML